MKKILTSALVILLCSSCAEVTNKNRSISSERELGWSELRANAMATALNAFYGVGMTDEIRQSSSDSEWQALREKAMAAALGVYKRAEEEKGFKENVSVPDHEWKTLREKAMTAALNVYHGVDEKQKNVEEPADQEWQLLREKARKAAGLK